MKGKEESAVLRLPSQSVQNSLAPLTSPSALHPLSGGVRRWIANKEEEEKHRWGEKEFYHVLLV